MNGPRETLPDGLPAGEELLAYLDGEMDADSRRRIEEQLSTSGELREKLKEYQQTWDLLDDLPRATVDDSFTRTTVEMVAIRAEDAVVESQAAKKKGRLIIWSLGLVIALLAGAIGYLITNRHYSGPNEQLVEDLPILEHFDAYRNAGSLDFIRQLEEQKLFQEESGDAL